MRTNITKCTLGVAVVSNKISIEVETQVFALALLFTRCYMKTPKMTPKSSRYYYKGTEISVECERQGINNQ